RSAALVFLEGNDLEWDAEDLGDFLRQLSIVSDFVVRSAQSTSHDLLAQQLRHERPESNDVCHRVAVPSLGQHPYAHDAAHVAPRRMQCACEFFGEFLEAFRVDRSTLPVLWPFCFAHRVERQAHPGVFITLGLAGVSLSNDLGINTDRVLALLRIEKAFNLCRRDSRGWIVLAKPPVNHV